MPKLYTTHIMPSTSHVDLLVTKAYDYAMKEVSRDSSARLRVKNALERRFKPYIQESESISNQVASSTYRAFKKEIREFIDAVTVVIACPDGRISPLALTDPGVFMIHRSLQGIIQTRLSTQGKRPIPSDVELRMRLWASLQKQKKSSEQAKLITFMGPHIHSMHPAHGCGAALAAKAAIGSALPHVISAKQYGGVRDYFNQVEANDSFHALDYFGTVAGARVGTIDYIHDIYSQGVILGLGIHHADIREHQSLRDNIIRLHEEKKIVVSELLADHYKNQIRTLFEMLTQKKLSVPVDYREYKNFAQNAIILGTIAKTLTIQEEKKGFPLLPLTLKNAYGYGQKASVYHLLRNVVYCTLASIKPGAHWLLQHPEQLLRIGPVGARFNVRTVAFIENAPSGFSPADMQACFSLYGLMEKIVTEQGIDLATEARVIMVTAAFRPEIYASDSIMKEEYMRVVTRVMEDAAAIKVMLKRAIYEGAAVVVSVLHHTDTRRIIDIV